jgi:hypothetical protein
MVLHICQLCNKKFTKKSSYDYHVKNKKNPCINVNHQLKNKNNEENEKNNTDIIKCNFCDKIFCRKDYLNIHIRDFCKNKKHFDNLDIIKNKINNTVIGINDDAKNIIEDNKKLILIIENYEKILKNNNLIKEIIPLSNTKINNTNNGTINNGTINNTTINNIVQFGKEDISKFNIIEMMNNFLKSTGSNIYPNMIKYINLNPNFPENNNICISDLAREIVKIYNGKKFVSKKFKNVKYEILNTINNHITNMCYSYMQNPKTKKSENILSVIKTNKISAKLINNDDITPLLTIKKENKKKIIDINTNKDNNDNNDTSESEYLDDEGEKKLLYYENKRQGLQEMTLDKLKDELYNNRDLVEK